ncbi:hypothetical protein DL93DRAFT_2151889 [Clavulina sp. PMI_390]|nr:hypothetical protein DL93DRAFT_2151889 [Clavulina sp. PMI_390]
MKRKKSHFLELPPELIQMVFNNITDLVDAFCLGITCTFLWSSGEHHIKKLWTAMQAPCVGHIIICIGDWLTAFPPACRTEEARDEIAQAYNHPTFATYQTMSEKERESLHSNGGSPWRAPRENDGPEDADDTLSLFMESLAFGLSGRTDNSRWSNGGQLYRFWGSKSAAGRFDWKLARLWIEGPHPRSSLERQNTLVLRNLSKRMFVRSDLLTSDPSDRARSLGQGLLYYICWSECTPSGFEGRDPIVSEGPWAGDRFDIITLESLGGDCLRLTNDGWKDASQEVRDRIEIVEGWDVLEEGRAPYEYQRKPVDEPQPEFESD